MTVSIQSRSKDAAAAGSDIKSLYLIGSIAPLLTIVLYLSEFIFIPWESYPASVEDWFALFQRSKFLGLFYLNALDIFSIAILGTMFLALYMALRRANEAYMSVAAFFAFLGVAVFIVPRVAMLSMLPLSDRYAAATSAAQRTQILAAGETLGALGTPTPQTVGFLFMAIAVLIISVVMLPSNLFNRVTASIGIGASVLTMVDFFSVFGAPAIATPLMIVSGLFWIPWWLLVSWGLFRLRNLDPMSPSR